MTFIIGDIHGEVTKLKKLIRNITSFDSSATFVFIGDYVDKGENSFETLDYLTAFGSAHSCIFLCGNHEFMWLNLNDDSDMESWLLKYGARATIRSMNVPNIREARAKLMEQFEGFFGSLKPFWKNDKYIAVHSGIGSDDYHTPVEEIPLKNLLFNRYDFLKQEQLYLGKYKVIFGHTGFYTPYIDKYKIGIDTAACFLENQPLTAFCPEQTMFLDSNDRKYFAEELPLNQCPNIPRTKPWREYVSI